MKRLLLILVFLSSLAWSQTTGGYFYTQISSATSTLIFASPNAVLHTVTLNGGTNGTVTIKDTTTAAACGGGATVAILTTAATVIPVTLTYDATMKNGLCITTSAATNLTVSWRY